MGHQGGNGCIIESVLFSPCPSLCPVMEFMSGLEYWTLQLYPTSGKSVNSKGSTFPVLSPFSVPLSGWDNSNASLSAHIKFVVRCITTCSPWSHFYIAQVLAQSCITVSSIYTSTLAQYGADGTVTLFPKVGLLFSFGEVAAAHIAVSRLQLVGRPPKDKVAWLYLSEIKLWLVWIFPSCSTKTRVKTLFIHF